MPQLYKTIVERKQSKLLTVVTTWKDVRAYLVMANSVDEADKMTPCFEGEFVRMVIPQDRSPYVYLLNEGELNER